MKLDQAVAINNRFVRMDKEIHDMRLVADSLATYGFRMKVSNNANILKLQQDLAYARINGINGQNRQAALMFGFWAVFVSYLQITR